MAQTRVYLYRDGDGNPPGVHCRILYFFSGKEIVVISHGLAKERKVPHKEIEYAIANKKNVEADFVRFTFDPESWLNSADI